LFVYLCVFVSLLEYIASFAKYSNNEKNKIK